ncbi:hypothetical protein HY638_00990 [Candidatus Woesearchaeota archaeon]|nr:hypothetical protein [Candidatus Woesearchaeota archaeon]
MKNFARVMREINLIINSIIIFDKFLNSLVVFLSFYLALILIGINPFYAAIPGIMFFVITVYLDFDKSKALLVEQKYPHLNEKLRTAFDNVYVENEIAYDLETDVTGDLRKVHVSAFIDTKKTSYKTTAVVALCFAVLLISAFGFRFLDVNVLFRDNLFSYFEGGDEPGAPSDVMSAGKGESKDIYGEEKLAELGNEELELNLKAVNYEVLSGNGYNEPPDVDFEDTFPDNICADDAGGCGNQDYSEDKTPVEHAELVKKYFLNIAK